MNKKKKTVCIMMMLICLMICCNANYNEAEKQACKSYEVENVESYVESVESDVENTEISFEKCAENDNLILLADCNRGIIALQNKSTGYTWYSNAGEQLSTNSLRYGIPKKRTDTLLRSDTDSKTTVEGISNGIRINYDYKAGFSFSVDYVLESDYLSASLKVSDIKETNPDNIATEVAVMENFGASSDDNGYFVIPDGSGALIRFNNNTASDSGTYSNKIYGNDITAVPAYDTAYSEQIYLSAYGIVRENNAMLVVASKGDSNAYITAKTAGQSNSSYNICHFNFTLRCTDTFYMSGNSTNKFTVFETGDIESDDIEVRYYPVAEKDADYIDIAEKYRDYLNIAPKKSSPALYVNIYGGTEKKKSVLGIPVTMKQSATSYTQATEILSELKSMGAENIVASYINWTDNGMENKIDTSAEPSYTLGGSDFDELKEFAEDNNISLCPATHNRDFISGNSYNSLNSTCIRASGAYSRIVSYDRAYGIPDGRQKNMSLISPRYFDNIYTKTAQSYTSKELSGIFPKHLASSLYGDYSKDKISRFKAMEYTTDALQTLSESLDIITDRANAYALPYISHITDMPLSSSRFDIFSEDIPFMQIVLHGVVPYSTVVNSSPNPTETLLKAVATGSMPCYDIISNPISTLNDTELDEYYYANSYDSAKKYTLLKSVFEDISDSTITDYKSEDNIITTSYSNGTVIITDMNRQTINFNGTEIYIGE